MPRGKKDTAKKQTKRGPTSGTTWTTCPAKLVTYLASISERALTDWVRKGLVKKTGHGKYNIKSVLKAALERDVFQGGTSLNEVTTDEIQQNKALLEKARADLAETEVAIEKRKLVEVEDLKGFLANQMVMFKKDLMSLPRTIPGACYGLTEKEIEEDLSSRISKYCEERFDNTELSSFIKFLDHAK